MENKIINLRYKTILKLIKNGIDSDEKIRNIKIDDIFNIKGITTDDIKNINGREKFSLDSGTLTWKSTGKDIFYQGKVTEELPIKVTAKYYLNGEEVNPKKIKGKSGNSL